MTKEQLDEIRARLDAALSYEPSKWDEEEGAYISPSEKADESSDCPLCDGQGFVWSQQYDAKETIAATVVAYGIGEGLARAEEWVEQAPADMRALLDEVERLRTAAIWEEDRVLRMVADAHLRGAQEATEKVKAEVERLKAREESLVKQVVAQIGLIGRQAEWREGAFKRGAEAMREAAALHVSTSADPDSLVAEFVEYRTKEIRDLPIPEDK
jgi:hypothetical protein